MQKLIIDGTIEKFTIDVNQEVLGPVVDAFVETKSKNDWSTEKFDSALLERSEIVDAVYLSGDFNYQIRVQCESINKLNDFLDFLRNQLNVEELRVKIALGTVSGYPRQLGLETEQQEKIVEEEATKTIETLEAKHYSHGISPNALLGATLYLACKKMKVRRSQLEIAKVVGTSEVTLRNRSKQIFTLLNSK